MLRLIGDWWLICRIQVLVRKQTKGSKVLLNIRIWLRNIGVHHLVARTHLQLRLQSLQFISQISTVHHINNETGVLPHWLPVLVTRRTCEFEFAWPWPTADYQDLTPEDVIRVPVLLNSLQKACSYWRCSTIGTLLELNSCELDLENKFETREEAVAVTLRLDAKGVRLI